MKSLTIHNIDEPLLAIIRELAQEKSTSINQFVKNILENAVGYKKAETPKYYNEYKEFCGLWTNEDLRDFEKSIKSFEAVDEEDWK